MEDDNKLNRAFHEANQNAQFVRLHKSALKVEFALTTDDLATVNKMYEPLIIKPGLAPASQHPIAAVHQRYAQSRSDSIAKTHRNIIEIGPNATNFAKTALGNPLAHGCTLASARDQCRHITSAMSAKLSGTRPNRQQIMDIKTTGLDHETYLYRVNALATNIASHTFCLHGWENCDFQAPIATAVHSLYDIDLAKLALGMHEHGCHRIRAWMHFPVQALEVEKWTDYENGYHFNTRGKGKDATIDFAFNGDFSFG